MWILNIAQRQTMNIHKVKSRYDAFPINCFEASSFRDWIISFSLISFNLHHTKDAANANAHTRKTCEKIQRQAISVWSKVNVDPVPS